MRFKPFQRLETKLSEALATGTYCQLNNLRNRLSGRLHQIEPAQDEDTAIHIASDGLNEIHICRRGRHRRYKRGVMAGVDRLAAEYGLDLLQDKRDGVFIDCGANVGELGYWAKARGFQYIAFEPEALEARCVDLNHFDGQERCIRKALWKEPATLKFFQKADTADSSTIQFGQGASVIEIEGIDLDSAVDVSQAKGPVILKLEAEGAEPEVLEGARKTLKKIDYVAIDCGRERGANKDHTIVETNTYLTQNGFRLLSFRLGRVTALYERV